MSFGPPSADQYTTETLADGVRYILPRRELGGARKAGCVLIVFAVVIVGFMCFWMSGPIRIGVEMLDEHREMGIASIAFGMTGLLGMIPGIGILLLGIAIFTNQIWCVVEVRNGKLFSNERVFGFFTWRRRRDAGSIKRLKIQTALSSRAGAQKHEIGVSSGITSYSIRAQEDSEREFIVAPGYPKDLLMQLAAEIAPRISAENFGFEDSLAQETGQADGTADGTDWDVDTVPEQPVASNATIERRQDGITIHIPPAGLWKGSNGMFSFSLVWNGLLIVVTAVAALSESEVPHPIAVAVFGLFYASGFGLFLGAFNMGRRRAIIATAGHQVLVLRESPFGKQSREWSVGEIERIVCDSNGMEVNDEPVNELQIHVKGEKTFGCLSQREDDELRWIVAELKRAIHPYRQEQL